MLLLSVYVCSRLLATLATLPNHGHHLLVLRLTFGLKPSNDSPKPETE